MPKVQHAGFGALHAPTVARYTMVNCTLLSMMPVLMA